MSINNKTRIHHITSATGDEGKMGLTGSTQPHPNVLQSATYPGSGAHSYGPLLDTQDGDGDAT